MKGLGIPIRRINGNLHPTQTEKNLEIYPDFDAVLLPDTGHYPTRKNPDLFNGPLE